MAQFTVKSCKIIKVNKIDRTWGGQLGGAGVSQFLFWPQSRLWQFDSSNFGLAFSFKPKLLLLQGHKKKVTSLKQRWKQDKTTSGRYRPISGLLQTSI
jgi:hypothetical protein